MDLFSVPKGKKIAREGEGTGQYSVAVQIYAKLKILSKINAYVLFSSEGMLRR